MNNPTYPITRDLNTATNGAPRGEVKAFLNWALSSDGHKVVKQRFVGVK